MSIVNSSTWPTTKIIDCTSKHQLIQHLVECEVYYKRQVAMTCLARGLDYWNLLILIERNQKSIIEYVNNATSVPLTAERILELVICQKEGEEREKAYGFFFNNLRSREGKGCTANRLLYYWSYLVSHVAAAAVSVPTLADVLCFWTGLQVIPASGMSNLVVKFLPCSNILPTAFTCFMTINIPTCHVTEQQFFASMDMGVSQSLGHFGIL